MTGVAAARRRYAPVRFVRMTASQASGLDLKMKPSRMIAALFTIRSTPPKRSWASSTASIATLRSAMSPEIAAAFALWRSTSSASFGSTGSPEIETPASTATTAAPCASRSSTIASPMPRAPPVTIATRPLRSMCASGLVVEGVGVDVAMREPARLERRRRCLDHHRRAGEIGLVAGGIRQILPQGLMHEPVPPATAADLFREHDVVAEVGVIGGEVLEERLAIQIALAPHPQVERDRRRA